MRALRTLVVLGAWLGVACAGPSYQYEDLPAEPIAIVYRTTQDVELVQDLLKQRAEKGKVKDPQNATFRLEDVGSLFGLYNTKEDRAAGLLGRLALLDAQTRAIELPEFAKKGSRPLAWSPDRTRLLFTNVRRGKPHVFEWHRDTGDVRPVTSRHADHLDACFGPDGSVAFSSVENNRSRVFIWRPGGGPPQPVTPGPFDGQPTWSPTGEHLVYRSMLDRKREVLRVIDPRDPGEPRTLAPGRRPTFTPDGRWVVYSAKTRKGWKLYKIRPDGGGRRRFGESPRQEHQPTVSPDGRFVAYVEETETRRQKIWIRAIDGTGDRPLVFDGDGFQPAW